MRRPTYSEWSLFDHLDLWLRSWPIVLAGVALATGAAWRLEPAPEQHAEGLVRIASIARLGLVESVPETVARIQSAGFLAMLRQNDPALRGGHLDAEPSSGPGMFRLHAYGKDEVDARRLFDAAFKHVARQQELVLEAMQELAPRQAEDTQTRIAALQADLGTCQPVGDQLAQLDYLGNLQDAALGFRMQLEARLVRHTEIMGAVVVDTLRSSRVRLSGALAGLLLGLFAAYWRDYEQRKREPPRGGSKDGSKDEVPQEETSKGPHAAAVAVVVALAAAGALGAGASRAPDWVTLLAVVLVGAVAAKQAPLALVTALAIYVPTQSAFNFVLPDTYRYVDELGLLALMAGALLWPFVDRPIAFLKDPIVRWVAAFAGWSLLSAAVNGVPVVVAGSGLAVTLDYLGLLLLLRTLPLDERAAKRLLHVTVALVFVSLAYGLAERLVPYELLPPWSLVLVESGVTRVPSIFPHPNDFGYTMLAAAFLLLGLLVARFKDTKDTVRAADLTDRPSPAANLGYLVAAAAAFAGVVLSVSRSSYVALAGGLVVALVLFGRRFLRVAAPIVLVVGLLGGGLAVRGVTSRLDKIAREGGDARFTYAKKSLALFADHPVFGVGPGRFGGEVAHRYGSPVYARYGIAFNDSWSTVDSFWIHLTGETGFVGTAIFLGLLAVVFRRCRAALAAGAPAFTRGILLAAPMLIVGEGMISASSMAFEANNLSGQLWLALGVGLSASGDRVSIG